MTVIRSLIIEHLPIWNKFFIVLQQCSILSEELIQVIPLEVLQFSLILSQLILILLHHWLLSLNLCIFLNKLCKLHRHCGDYRDIIKVETLPHELVLGIFPVVAKDHRFNLVCLHGIRLAV